MKQKTFISGVTGMKISSLANNLQTEYATLNPKLSSGFIKRKYTIDKRSIYVLERSRYDIGDKKGRTNPILIPHFEISNKMYQDSPILFVGMNPSGADIEHYKDYNTFFTSIPHDVFIYDGNSSYYVAMEKFASECLKGIGNDNAEGKYSEIDLFGIVQSTQEVIQKDFLAYPNDYKEMFNLFLDYAARINPKVIIVANALVRKILKRDSDLKLNVNAIYGAFYNNGSSPKFKLVENKAFGGYRFSIKDFETQLYFSSMLSGQRALDNGSRESLIWLVRNYLSHNP